jgi:hypothetical protein
MKSRVYHGGKPEARHQLIEAIESAADIRNELGCMQCHNYWQHACSLMVGILNMCCDSFETYCCEHLK